MRFPPAVLLPVALLLAACDEPADTAPAATCDEAALQTDLAPGTAGAPMAGVAEAALELPVGTPLSGYTSRCSCWGGDGKADRRKSNYADQFAASAGLQTQVPVKAFWISNGDQDLVILHTDVIYSFDGLVEEVERRLTEATGKDMDGKVVVATNHSHSSYGDFTDQVTYYLGSDKFNFEVFSRMATTMEEAALEAHDTLQPVKIGFGFAKDWDPYDLVYHDRRDNNDGLQFFDDIPAGSYKDPTLTLVRIDTLDDQPLGVLFDFGMHGTTLGADNPMISVEAPGHVELALQERFDLPVVVSHLQGSAGDASPSGSDDGYARLESIGEWAADAIYDLWAHTPTSADPITLETASRAIPEHHDDIRVTRDGTVDLHYQPFDPDYEPDNVVYGDDGSILSPLDEFNTDYGEAFCGEDVAYLPGYAPAEVFPYDRCTPVSVMVGVIRGFFDLEEADAPLPLKESLRASVTAVRIGKVPIVDPDGSTTTDDVLIGFFPGETTSLYNEWFRRRAAAELGFAHTMAVGYAQDHEGYLLIPEDWLMGGYEADINIWGPLQAEHIMEGLLTMAKEHLLTPEIEKQDPCGEWQPVAWGPYELPELTPDDTPEAGTAYTGATAPDYVYSPLYSQAEVDAGLGPTLDVPAVVPRVQGLVEFAWSGGDPGVDLPSVTLERKGGDGSWSPVSTRSGRTVTLGPDILLTTTPDPLYPATDAQSHTWYAAWQAVGHDEDRAGVPEGTYRLSVTGDTWRGGQTTWPWDTDVYTVTSPEFAVVPAALTVSVGASTVSATLRAPERGYRLVGLYGYFRGDNPLPGDEATLTRVYEDGTRDTVAVSGTSSGGWTSFSTDLTGVVEVEVVDRYGNGGSATIP